jgi:hypothetical protein
VYLDELGIHLLNFYIFELGRCNFIYSWHSKSVNGLWNLLLLKLEAYGTLKYSSHVLIIWDYIASSFYYQLPIEHVDVLGENMHILYVVWDTNYNHK